MPGGVVHKLPADLRTALVANTTALEAWNDITPSGPQRVHLLGRRRQAGETRERRIRRTQEELEEGQRRPCCWPGCTAPRAHRRIESARFTVPPVERVVATPNLVGDLVGGHVSTNRSPAMSSAIEAGRYCQSP